MSYATPVCAEVMLGGGQLAATGEGGRHRGGVSREGFEGSEMKIDARAADTVECEVKRESQVKEGRRGRGEMECTGAVPTLNGTTSFCSAPLECLLGGRR